MGLLQIHIKVSLKRLCFHVAMWPIERNDLLSQHCTSSRPFAPTGVQRLDDDCTSSFLRVQKKEYKKRATTTIPFTLTDGVELGVSV